MLIGIVSVSAVECLMAGLVPPMTPVAASPFVQLWA
jgi:hypothetical protein